MQAKLSELWEEVEKALDEKTLSGAKFAIIEAFKVLNAVLDSKGYPGKDIKQKLYWAGYSEKNEDLLKALRKREEVLNDFSYQLTDLEAEEIVHELKKITATVSKKQKMSIAERAKAFYEIYLSPKEVSFWRNLLIFVSFFTAIKLLVYTDFGKAVGEWFVNAADFIISWTFLLLVVVIVMAIIFLNNYLKNRPRVNIKEEQQ